ncbi:very short patch repair endonuclease [Oleiharenicola lentus]|uniref:Very short patch repair endonuclease n=2 Tax=Oleiharenicola lentus TaxID=2508720 RepID=A0A4Q1C8Y0_9BACT|nr:very short patch repair endonuclease [Oleiharenicola lentus]
MSRIRSTGNKATELQLIQIFRANGIRGWRRGASLQWKVGSAKLKTFRVKPDFVFPKLKTAVFVDGCFWHGCPKHAIWPKTRAAFWRKKIEGNRTRDRRVNRALRGRGWAVIRIWEHELRRKNEACLLRRLAVVGGTKPGRAKMVAPKGAAPKR